MGSRTMKKIFSEENISLLRRAKHLKKPYHQYPVVEKSNQWVNPIEQ